MSELAYYSVIKGVKAKKPRAKKSKPISLKSVFRQTMSPAEKKAKAKIYAKQRQDILVKAKKEAGIPVRGAKMTVAEKKAKAAIRRKRDANLIKQYKLKHGL